MRLEALLRSLQGILYQRQVALHDCALHEHSEEKVIGFSAGAAPLLDKAGASTAGRPVDAGVIAFDGAGAGSFIDVASRGRVWPREPIIKKTY